MATLPTISKIIELPLVDQLAFADAICKQNVNNPEILKGLEDKPEFFRWNATSIANLAYIEVHCNSTHYRGLANRLRNQYKHWYLKFSRDVFKS